MSAAAWHRSVFGKNSVSINPILMIVRVATMLFFLLYGLTHFVSVAQAGLIIAVCALIVGVAMLIDLIGSKKAS